MRLLLIRHAESEHSQRRMIAGVHGCLGLTAHGHEQAAALAARLQRTGAAAEAAALLTSPVLRARQSAEALLLALPAATLREEPLLEELRPGQADGMLWLDHVAQHGEVDLVVEPERPFAPGGESWQGFLARVAQSLAQLAAEYDGQTVVAVTHGGYIVASMLLLLGIPRPGTGAHLSPSFTGITEWEQREGRWTLLRYNDAAP